MVVKEDGTKWACHSCLKGHRVSGCTHTDRELVLVPKKGRPVTQCQHCRLERKKRSAHVKCECGEVEKPHHSKEKCIHLRELEERTRAGFHDDHPIEKDASHLTAVAEEQGCCCLHGGKCSCALLRKEQDRLDDSTLPHGPAVQKPRLETTRSDGSITVFANGHHKPVHRKNHAAHECGMPYKMPMSRAHTDQKVSTVARRSVDSLILDTRARPSYIYSAGSSSSVTDGELSRSEYPSPKMEPVGSCGGLGSSRLSSIDFSSLGPTMTNQSIESTASDLMAFPPMDPMSAAADSSFDPWSALSSAEANRYFPDNNPFGAWATHFDGGNAAQPALTAASSGTQSESDEIPHMDDLYGFPMPSIQEDEGPSMNMPIDSGDSANLNRRSLPPNFFGNADLSLPPQGTEWQTALNGAGGLPVDSKKAMSSIQSFEPHQWTPTMSMMNTAQRSSSDNTPSAGRPQSHSVGPASAPNEDIIKQLFPDIDVSSGFNLNGFNNLNGSASGPNSPATWKKFGVLPNSNPNYTNMNDDVAFTSQPWTDGSVSVPNDAFMPPFNLDQDYPTPDFSTWQQ